MSSSGSDEPPLERTMCFSPEADLVGGIVVGSLGIDALRHVQVRAELPLGSIPVLLAFHQLVEALVWLGLQGHVSQGVWRPALVAYIVIALVVLPVLVPLAIGLLEPAPNRRRIGALTLVGVGVSGVLLHAAARGPILAAIRGHHIAYDLDLSSAAGVVIVLYVVVTCGSLLLSSHAHVRWFGLANLAAAGLLSWLDQSAFVSLWCAWAAVASLAIAAHLRRPHPAPRPGLDVHLR